MSPLKIAQVATTDVAIRLLLLDQIRALQARKHDVVAVCSPGPRVEQLRDQGIRVETLEMARELAPLRDAVSLRELVRCFRSHKFDVVHTHTPKAGLLGPLAAKMAGVPVVVHTIHGLLFHDRMPSWRRAIFWVPEKITATFSDYMLSQSREDIAEATRTWLCAPGKIAYLGNGIDSARFSPAAAHDRSETLAGIGISSSDFIIGSVGRLVREKGFLELFAIAEKLTARYSDMKFIVIGPRETDQNDALDPRYIADLSRRGVVQFLDWREDLVRWYAAMDVFLLPSYREGLPRACMEAAAMMRPVIASDIRGCREVVLHGKTGLLVPSRNVRALGEAIESLYWDRERGRQMGQLARQHIVENFKSELVCERLCDFYSRISRSVRMVDACEEPAYH